jgi:hypothetical protein
MGTLVFLALKNLNKLAAPGPRISQVEETFAKRYGWTPDRA